MDKMQFRSQTTFSLYLKKKKLRKIRRCFQKNVALFYSRSHTIQIMKNHDIHSIARPVHLDT